jgi:hypothetical protein
MAKGVRSARWGSNLHRAKHRAPQMASKKKVQWITYRAGGSVVNESMVLTRVDWNKVLRWFPLELTI